MVTRGVLALAMLAAPAAALELGLPVACKIGTDCFVQHYVDLDPGPGIKDYACGAASNDQHDGIDIRVRTLADSGRGVAVIAAAAGVVAGGRDGMADRLVRSQADAAAIKGRDCGNGVRIDHGGGYETQYCHMREGTVAVSNGERVEAGQMLGLVGYSGNAGFPHVHMTVRKDGKALDPFRPDGDAMPCAAARDMLWGREAAAALAYSPSDLLAVGFADRRVELEDLEAGTVLDADLNAQSPALVAYGWAIKLRAGDRLAVRLVRPDGSALAQNEATLDRNKAQYMLFAGTKRPAEGWPSGTYRAQFVVERGPERVIDRETNVTLR